jgi:hypothetical protein
MTTMKPIIPPAHIAPAGYRYLFFFGDFLNEEELGDLGIIPRPVCIAYNRSRRWIISPNGHATMIGQRDFNVYGVVHQIPDPEVVALDLPWMCPLRGIGLEPSCVSSMGD